MMHPTYHPSDAVLLDHAAGALHEAQSLAVAAHAELCPQCRQRIAKAEAVGGSLLDDLAPEAVSASALANVMGRLDEPAPVLAPAALPFRPDLAWMPRTLRRYVTGDAPLPWRRLAPGIKHLLLSTGDRATARLMRVDPGVCLPSHGHRGLEMTLVLEGGFSDALGHFVRGDVAELSEMDRHQPVIDADGPCIALVVTEAPAVYDGLVYRLLQPMIGL
ncbi:MAG: ChrR family anti-sigma-E factor [Magnetospiraceae bacterium]